MKEGIKRFLDFIEFEIGNDIEQRCNKFAEKGKNDISWTLHKVMVFLQFQKERSRRKEITAQL
jgi:hypothetical protein